MTDYDTLPIKTFYKILSDETKLKELGIEDKVWEEIKDEWRERHPSGEGIELNSALKKVMLENIELNKRIYVLRLASNYQGDIKELYKVAKLRFVEDPDQRYKNLIKEIEKSKSKTEIFEARFSKIQEQIKESKKKDAGRKIKLKDINASIASLELHGFTIDNYEQLTCGKYDAITKIIKDKK
jgi:2',3'-cyclic-nucleotide 2'-phosphodiesterase (5'-nucleotidase family)